MAGACVLCLGNPWHGDDGFGHHVFLRLQAEHALPQGVELVDAGVAGLNALRWLDGCATAVLVDAVRVGARIGTVHRLDASDLEPHGDELSLHELGVASLLAAHTAAGGGAEFVVVGAEVGPVRAFTDALSPPVRAAVPTAAAMVMREVATLSRPAVPTRPRDRPPPYASGTGAS
jgi:hydrogenase maturation protease